MSGRGRRPPSPGACAPFGAEVPRPSLILCFDAGRNVASVGRFAGEVRHSFSDTALDLELMVPQFRLFVHRYRPKIACRLGAEHALLSMNGVLTVLPLSWEDASIEAAHAIAYAGDRGLRATADGWLLGLTSVAAVCRGGFES